MVDYDVFLNHHGPDTKYGLMSNLEKALKNVGLKPFLDRTSVKEQAGHVPTLICNALEVVKVNVAVVSKGYAGSAYCLNELVIMMESFREEEKPVIPILYDVDFEADLRWFKHREGLYAPAFQDHFSSCRDIQRDIVEGWAVALNKLADMAGFSKAAYNSRGEAALIDDVVARVMDFFPQEIVPFMAEERREYKSPATQSWFGAVDQEVGEPSRRGEDRSGAQQTTPLEHSLEYYEAVRRRTSHNDYKSSGVELFVPQCCNVQCQVEIKSCLFGIRGVDHVTVDYNQKVTVNGIAKEEKILTMISSKRKGARLYDYKQDYNGNPRPKWCH